MIVLIAWAAGNAWAQIGSEGTIRGVVKDEQGGVLPGVTVTATSTSVAGAVIAVTGADARTTRSWPTASSRARAGSSRGPDN